VDGAAEDVAGVDIPRPRSPLDDLPVISHPVTESATESAVDLPQIGSVEPIWRYDQDGKRGKRRRYNGYVDRIGGAEGEQLRETLAAAIRDLLDWAAEHTQEQHTDNVENVDSDGESGTDSGRDDAADGGRGADDTPA
jgi:hypothetical protein